MKQYLSILEQALDSPVRSTRNGEVRSFFNANFSIDCSVEFPLLTTKKLHFKSIAIELLWFLKAKPLQNMNGYYLNYNGVKIWNSWMDDQGNLGQIYGSQWSRRLPQVINEIKHSPTSRRLCVSSWQEDCIDTMALPPCHLYYQFYCTEDNFLHLSFTMRSTDVFLGLPYNIASYALLLNIVAKMTGRLPGKLHVHLNDVHLYENHVEQAKVQLSREPSKLPSLDVLTKRLSIDRYEYEDFKLWDYNAQAHIKGEVSK